MIREFAGAGRFAGTPVGGPVDGGELLARLEACDLRGRGGGAFPTAAKLRSVRAAPAEEKIVIANGEEGEPGSLKDKWLLRNRPDLVLDGLSRAAAITGARRGHVYVSDDASADAVAQAIVEHPRPLRIDVVRVPHTYVAGEESAAVRFVRGGSALPTAKPPRPYEKGVLVANVETLAQIALQASGPGPLTTLVTLQGAALPAALYEIPAGTALGELAAHHGLPRLAAALPGGVFGRLAGPEAALLPLDRLGVVHLLAPGACPVALVSAAQTFLMNESARQCGVCVMGTRSLAETVTAIGAGTATPADRDLLAVRAAKLPGRGACALLDAAAHLAASLLTTFPEVVARHLSGPCPGCRDIPSLRAVPQGATL